jgi:SNF2 family DNA or RNA helicase
MLSESPRAYVLSEIGTGKTLSAIFAAEYLRQMGEVKRACVIAPLSTLTLVWEHELFLACPRAITHLLYGTKAKRRELLRQDADWYVINHHGLPLILDDLIKRKFDLVIIDELAVFRKQRTQLWKAANALIQSGVKYVWGMTGAPRPKAPTDAWAQIRLLTPEKTSRTFTRFRDSTMQQITQFKWVERMGANDIVFGQMQPSVRFALDDVHELPELIYRDVSIPLEPEAQRAYKMMCDKLFMMSKAGEITAANEGVLQSKLLQVACGFIYTDTHQVYNLPNKPRLDMLADICAAATKKVIIFSPFVHSLAMIATYLRGCGEIVDTVHGGTPKGKRDEIFQAFQSSPIPHVLVAHPQCMAHGLTLTSANTIVWFTATNNPETYQQANGRIRRPGQTSKTQIIHLTGTPIERLAYSRLKSRTRMQGLLLELFREQELDY